MLWELRGKWDIKTINTSTIVNTVTYKNSSFYACALHRLWTVGALFIVGLLSIRVSVRPCVRPTNTIFHKPLKEVNQIYIFGAFGNKDELIRLRSKGQRSRS